MYVVTSRMAHLWQAYCYGVSYAGDLYASDVHNPYCTLHWYDKLRTQNKDEKHGITLPIHGDNQNLMLFSAAAYFILISLGIFQRGTP